MTNGMCWQIDNKQGGKNMSVIYNESHPPQKLRGLLGCCGYSSGDLICLIANGDNNFVQEGIVENSLLFIDKNKEYESDRLNVYQFPNEQYKLSRTNVDRADYIGRVILVANQYE